MQTDFIHVGREHWFGLPASVRVGALVLLGAAVLSLAARWRWNPERTATKLIESAAAQLVRDAVSAVRKGQHGKSQGAVGIYYYCYADAYLRAALRLVSSASELSRVARVSVQGLQRQIHTALKGE